MFCTNCGKELSGDCKFCFNCGTKHGENAPVSGKEVLTDTGESVKSKFCRTCGKELNTQAEICMGCGCRPTVGKAYCQNCGVNITNKNQEMCIVCGSRLVSGNQGSRNTSSSLGGGGIFDGDGSENYDFSGLDWYYQEEFSKMKDNPLYRGKFNWAAFFFGMWWMMYRNMVIPGIAVLVIYLVLVTITYGIGGIALLIVIGLRGNFIYYNYFTKKQFKIS